MATAVDNIIQPVDQATIMTTLRQRAANPAWTQDTICKQLQNCYIAISEHNGFWNELIGRKKSGSSGWLKTAVSILLKHIEDRLNEVYQQDQYAHQALLIKLERTLVAQSIHYGIDEWPPALQTNIKLRRRAQFNATLATYKPSLDKTLERARKVLVDAQAKYDALAAKKTTMEALVAAPDAETSPDGWKRLDEMAKAHELSIKWNNH